jgi:DNA-binding SARP family transcriptional activator
LGKFKVEVQGVALDLQPPAKALKILKLLVHRQGHPSPREALAEALWPESDPEVAFNRLRVAIHSLRQALVKWANLKDVVVYHGGVYGLNPQLDLWVDADEFEQRWRQGVRLDASGLPREAMVSYRQAELVYQGDYLEDDPYEEWTFLRRERLRDAYLHLLGKLAAGYFEEPDYGSCIACCHKILAEDPYREDTYRQLMGCYAAMGQKAVALHWYQVCHATLRKGLDVEPSIQTSRLSQQILSDPA